MLAHNVQCILFWRVRNQNEIKNNNYGIIMDE